MFSIGHQLLDGRARSDEEKSTKVVMSIPNNLSDAKIHGE